MKLASIVMISTLSMGTALAQNVDMPPDAATKPVLERSQTDPGLGATDDRPGPPKELGEEPSSGAILLPDFSLIDENQDGYVSEEEAAAYPGVNDNFRSLDRDGDDQLSAEEFSRYSKPESQ